MPLAELRVQIPAPLLPEYDAAVACFTALPALDRLTLRRLWVLGPTALDNEYYARMRDSALVCRVATSDGFLMGCTVMGGMLCKAYKDKFVEDINDASSVRL